MMTTNKKGGQGTAIGDETLIRLIRKHISQHGQEEAQQEKCE